MKSLKHKITRAKLDPFLKIHSSNQYTLDVGCANSPYADLFPNRKGIDVVGGQGVDIVADAHSLPFDDNEFEVILCTEVLEHLKSPKTAIKEMKRVLKPSGKLILTTRFIFPLHDVPGDYWRFTKYGLEYLFAGWQIEEFKEEATTLETLGVLMQRIAFQCNFKYRFLENVFHLTARFFTKLNFLIVSQYGSKGKKTEQAEKQILTSGYYLVCRNVK